MGKMKKISILDLFSGIGGFSKGFIDAGYDIENHYFSEIDIHAIANYKYNFKNAEHIGSVEHILNAGIERPDIITFGSPCQDFSLAGKRRGLEGDRSSLIEYAITAISHFRPDIFIWENVKGAFSSNNSADFWAIIKAFADIGGYRLEWQLLNTAWLLPQNRERIYLIGHLATSKRNWRAVFPIGENDRLSKGPNEPGERQPQTGDISTTLTKGNLRATDTFIQCIDMKSLKSTTRRGMFRKNQAHTLDTDCNQSIGNYIQLDVSGKGHNSQQDRVFFENGQMGTIPSGRTESKVNILTKEMKLRRLTEIECERLQGFPDNWTKYGNYDGIVKEISKTQRYKMLGNAVTVDVVKMIAEKLIKNKNLDN